MTLFLVFSRCKEIEGAYPCDKRPAAFIANAYHFNLYTKSTKSACENNSMH
jgi:hypothetical protein